MCDGEAELFSPADFAGNMGTARLGETGVGERTTVTTARLDPLLGSRTVAAMKIDVEGHEPAVLRGAAEALAAGRIRNVVFEDHAGPDSPAGRFLAGFGYAIRGIGWGLFGPVLAPPGVPVHHSYEAPNYLATLDPDAAAARCRRRGWACLTRRRR